MKLQLMYMYSPVLLAALAKVLWHSSSTVVLYCATTLQPLLLPCSHRAWHAVLYCTPAGLQGIAIII